MTASGGIITPSGAIGQNPMSTIWQTLSLDPWVTGLDARCDDDEKTDPAPAPAPPSEGDKLVKFFFSDKQKTSPIPRPEDFKGGRIDRTLLYRVLRTGNYPVSVMRRFSEDKNGLCRTTQRVMLEAGDVFNDHVYDHDDGAVLKVDREIIHENLSYIWAYVHVPAPLVETYIYERGPTGFQRRYVSGHTEPAE